MKHVFPRFFSPTPFFLPVAFFFAFFGASESSLDFVLFLGRRITPDCSDSSPESHELVLTVSVDSPTVIDFVDTSSRFTEVSESLVTSICDVLALSSFRIPPSPLSSSTKSSQS